MEDRKVILVFMVLITIINTAYSSVVVVTCVSQADNTKSYCTSCCGNTTIYGWGTLPCCEDPVNEPPRYTYLLIVVGLLIPCSLCLLILRRSGDRCRQPEHAYRRPSRREENLQGTMPGFGDRRLMVATIADFIYQTRESMHNTPADIVYPPSYDDVVKESNDEVKPPQYSDVLKMDAENAIPPHETVHDPPCDLTSINISGESSTLSSPNPSTSMTSSRPSTSSDGSFSTVTSELSTVRENTNAENAHDNRAFSPESANDITEQRNNSSISNNIT